MANGNMSRRTSSSAPSQKNNTKPVKTRKEVIDKQIKKLNNLTNI